MHINTFWKIVIKCVGLWLVINSVWIIPQLTPVIYFFIDDKIGWDTLVLVWYLIILIVYIFVTRLFLFKTDWIIKILKLDKNFVEDKIELKIPAKTILSITVTLIGSIWFLKSFPNLTSSIFEFLRQRELIKDYDKTGLLIYYFFSTVIGFLIMTNGKSVSNYIWKENSENKNGI